MGERKGGKEKACTEREGKIRGNEGEKKEKKKKNEHRMIIVQEKSKERRIKRG